LFNEPRRKKECHERIIREILPSKTSRAIEGKIRTLEKRYLKAAGEIQREDFVTAHPGKRAEDVAEALANSTEGADIGGDQTTHPGGGFRDTNEHSHARSVSISAVQGTREELEWLQFNLRREELEFRKSVFAQEQELETKRVRLEERRLDIKRHELELEGKRVDMQQRQVDLQLETMKSMSTMLSQMTKQMGNMLGAASATSTRAPAASSTADGEDANSAIEQQDSVLE
ncbi:hypothetical protein GGI11_007718, partial [Coemansia sp. RSA 2049]